uniref:F-box domain-containing protein n=1 Tax=Steinernema glaseri TaxID=37863 RepID=A0A1I7YB08_9BILA
MDQSRTVESMEAPPERPTNEAAAEEALSNDFAALSLDIIYDVLAQRRSWKLGQLCQLAEIDGPWSDLVRRKFYVSGDLGKLRYYGFDPDKEYGSVLTPDELKDFYIARVYISDNYPNPFDKYFPVAENFFDYLWIWLDDLSTIPPALLNNIRTRLSALIISQHEVLRGLEKSNFLSEEADH